MYRNELLYRHRIDPFRIGTHIDEGEFDAMWTDLVELMKVGFRRGKIIVVRSEEAMPVAGAEVIPINGELNRNTCCRHRKMATRVRWRLTRCIDAPGMAVPRTRPWRRTLAAGCRGEGRRSVLASIGRVNESKVRSRQTNVADQCSTT